MSPSSISGEQLDGASVGAVRIHSSLDMSYVMDRDLNKVPDEALYGKGNYIYVCERSVFDASCGAAVSCLGHGNKEVADAVSEQMGDISYANSLRFTTASSKRLSEQIIESTGHKMARVYICSSGSEAADAAMKMAWQYFRELPTPEPQRVNYIAREHSYHGNTIGALSLSGHLARRKPYIGNLLTNVSWVPACNAYRQRLSPLESDAAFVARKAQELRNMFLQLGPRTVAAFICEPISGAALGCVPYVPGYLSAMKAICVEYGALFILDEVMCGMGRSGTMHAWQGENAEGRDCVPDIQTIGKGLGGGFLPVAGVLCSHKVVKAMQKGSGSFQHGQTYQAHPIACAAASKVLEIIVRDNLVKNVQQQGSYLSHLLHKNLDSHPNVGNIRGLGLFLGIEFVMNKVTKQPFSAKLNVAMRVHDTSLAPPFNMGMYMGQGTVDGWEGDHVILAPAYNISAVDVEFIARTITMVIDQVFASTELMKMQRVLT